MKYLTVTEFCKKYGKQQAVVSRMIKAGRIPAERHGWIYLIPADVEPPEDRRRKGSKE